MAGGDIDQYRAQTAPVYGDFSNVDDYQHALDQVANYKSWFAAQPAGFRRRFNEDPQAVLKFVDDPKHLDESLRLGLISEAEYNRLAPPVPDPKPAATPPPAAGGGDNSTPAPTPSASHSTPSE